MSDYWTLSFTPQRCINEAAHLLSAGIINTVTDLVIVLLPIKTVMGLNLPVSQRLVVYLLFAGGFLASIAGAVRTYFVFQVDTSEDRDLTWNSYYAVLSASVELFVGIVCHNSLSLPLPCLMSKPPHGNMMIRMSYANQVCFNHRYVHLSRRRNPSSASTSRASCGQ